MDTNHLTSMFNALNTSNENTYSSSDMNYDFHLATEMDVAEKFDDLVFRYIDGGETKYRFLQAKHKQDQSLKISLRDFLQPTSSSNTEFSLSKYFVSYRRIKRRLTNNCEGFPYGIIQDCIICTNSDVENRLNEKFDILTERDVILDFDCQHALKRHPRKLKFKTENVNPEILKVLKNSSDTYILASILAKGILENKKIGISDSLMKRYHRALVSYVIDVENKKFYPQFLEGITSDEVRLFRKVFKEHIVRKKSWVDLYNYQFQFTQRFVGFKEFMPNGFILPCDHPVSEDEIIEFLNKLTLAVNQPDEIELGELVRSEIGDDSMFNLIDSDLVADNIQRVMLDWFKEKCGTFMTNHQGRDFFLETKAKVNKLVMIGPTLEYRSNLEQLGLSFKDEPVLIDFLFQDTFQILVVTSQQHTILSAMKVSQVIKNHPYYQKDDSYIFVCAASFIRLYAQMKYTFFQNSTRLLVIHCDNSYANADVLSNNVNIILQTNTWKKLILITRTNDPLATFPGHTNRWLLEDKNDFSSLTTECQRNVSEKIILYQGQEVMLRDAVQIYLVGDIAGIFNEKALTEILEPINLGVDFSGYDFFYIKIPRTFEYQLICVDKNCLREIMHDIFAISNICTFDFNNLVENTRRGNYSDTDTECNRIVHLDETNPAQHFAQLCHDNDTITVHWLINRRDGKLGWHKTQGSLSTIRSYKLKECELIIPTVFSDFKLPNAGTNLESQIFIIAGEPGIGKSTAMKQISEHSKNITPYLFVISIDLILHNLLLKNTNFSNWSDVITFLVGVLRVETEVAKNILIYKLTKEHNDCVVVLDRYDELSTQDQRKVIGFVKALKADGKGLQIFIIVRKYFQNEVEDAFGQFAYTLKGFTEGEIEHFLFSYWTQENIEHLDKATAQFFIKYMAMKILKFRERPDFVGVALQSQMIAEVFSKDFQKFTSPQCIDHLDEYVFDFNLDELYKQFVGVKFSKYFQEYLKIDSILHPGSREALIKSYIKTHRSLAFESLFPENPIIELFKNRVKFSQQELGQIGIIGNFENKNAHFTHQTYAEFFISDALIDVLQRSPEDAKYNLARTFLLRQIFLNRNSVIRNFIQCRVAKSKNDDLKSKWLDIEYLFREIQPIRINFLLRSDSNDIKTLDNSKPLDLVTCINKFTDPSILKWKGNSYCYWGDINLFDELCISFLKENKIQKLQMALEVIMRHAHKSQYGKLYTKISENIDSLVIHYMKQAKGLHCINDDFIKDIILKPLAEQYHIFHVFLSTFDYCFDLQRFITELEQSPNNINRFGLFAYFSKHYSLALFEQILCGVCHLFSTNGNNIRWLEQKGVCICVNLRILTPGIASIFKSMQTMSQHGWKMIYEDNIFHKLILPLLEIIANDQIHDICVPELMKMVIIFTDSLMVHAAHLTIKPIHVTTVLATFETIIKTCGPTDEATFDLETYFGILRQLGFKIIKDNNEILVIYPSSDFVHVVHHTHNINN